MRDLLSKLDAIVSETELRDKEDLQAKRKALQDLQTDPVASEDPEIKQAIIQRKADLEKEAKSKGFSESFEIGDNFGISFSEDFEISTEITDILEDGIVIDLDDTALDMLTKEGLVFLDGEIVREEKQKGVDGKACWKGYKRMGTKKKGGKTVDNCVKVSEAISPDADMALYKLAQNGDFDEIYDAMGRADEVGQKLQDMSNEISADTGLHPDDDIEKIIYRIADQLADEYSNFDDTPDTYPDDSMDGDHDSAMASAGFGSDEDYGYYGNDESQQNEYFYFDKKSTKDRGPRDTGSDELERRSKLGKNPLVKHGKEYKDKDKHGNMYKIGGPKGKLPEDADVDEAKYQGREVPLGKKMAGDVKKSKVYVRKPNGNIVKVNFGDKKMRIKKSNPKRRKSFRARHNCKNPGPRWKARYWSCRSW